METKDAELAHLKKELENKEKQLKDCRLMNFPKMIKQYEEILTHANALNEIARRLAEALEKTYHGSQNKADCEICQALAAWTKFQENK